MLRAPPEPPRTDPAFPYTTRFRAGKPDLFQQLAKHVRRQQRPALARRRRPVGIGDGPATRIDEILPRDGIDGGKDLGRVHSRRAKLAHDHSRSEEHTSELQSLMRISYAVFCLKKKKKRKNSITRQNKV